MPTNYNDFFLNKIKQDELVYSFFKELNDKQREDSIILLYDQAVNNSKCEKCLGKEVCQMDPINYKTYLTLDNEVVHKNVKPCEYIPTYNFDLVDILYMPEDLFIGEVDYDNKERLPFFNKAVQISNGTDLKGTYLYGKYGTGKSFLTFNLVNKLAKTGKSVVYCLTPELIRTIKNNLLVPSFMDKLIAKLKNVDILVLDDLGGELNSAFTRDEILFPILDSRMNNKKLTFATSNLSLIDLENHFADEKDKIDRVASGRIMERIRSLMTDIELDGMNYRH